MTTQTQGRQRPIKLSKAQSGALAWMLRYDGETLVYFNVAGNPSAHVRPKLLNQRQWTHYINRATWRGLVSRGLVEFDRTLPNEWQLWRVSEWGIRNAHGYTTMRDDILWDARNEKCGLARGLDRDIRLLPLPAYKVEDVQAELVRILDYICAIEAEMTARGDEVVPFSLNVEAA